MEDFFVWFVLFLFIFATFFVFWFSRRAAISARDQQRIIAHWTAILHQAESDPKHSVLEADKLLDEVLRLKGYRGSLGEKLKCADRLFKNSNGVWKAHKLRNRIAHELNVNVSPKEARDALSHFRSAIRDLGISL